MTARRKRARDPLPLDLLLTFALGLVAFLPGLGFPSGYSADEHLYVPAAREFLAGGAGVNQNWTHPPLGKALIALGIAIAGDGPWGWRLMPAIFGALALAGMLAWGRALRFTRAQAWLGVAFTLMSLMLFAPARTAQLDVFMVAFLTWGMALFSSYWLGLGGSGSGSAPRFLLPAAGACLGLAAACKVFGAIPLALALVLTLAVRAGRERWKHALLSLIIVPWIAYLAAHAPALGMKHPDYAIPIGTKQYSLGDLGSLQLKMVEAQVRFDEPINSDASPWWSWPFLKRPYAHRHEITGPPEARHARAVWMLGNVVVFLVGFAAVGVCAWAGVRRKRPEAFLIAVTYLAFWLAWAVVPRKVGFFHYYLPAAMVLPLAIVAALSLLRGAASHSREKLVTAAVVAASLLVFVLHLPLVTGIPLSEPAYRARLWLSSWR